MSLKKEEEREREPRRKIVDDVCGKGDCISVYFPK
jgi:hypothetical protein